MSAATYIGRGFMTLNRARAQAKRAAVLTVVAAAAIALAEPAAAQFWGDRYYGGGDRYNGGGYRN